MDVGDALPLVLDTPAGVVRIEGRTVLKIFDHHHFEMADTSVLEQGWRATCGTERRPSACSSAARCASASPTCRLPEPRRNSAESDREPASRRTRDRRRGRHRGGDLLLAGARGSRGRRARPRRAQYDGGHKVHRSSERKRHRRRRRRGRPRPCRQIIGGTTRGLAGVDELACFMDRGREFGYG